MSIFFGFLLLEEQDIPELNSNVRFYRHEKTGAELLSIENDDRNKVFGISFRTPPPDSSGIAHIMEHSVLCGSRKYPVKEPFVELIRGSLKTFLNAFTYPDKTCYPLASQNLKDFYNLIGVYMDAVLYPLIPPHILAQEGWHYELDSIDSSLIYKGVVFNEMKGAYSDPDNVLARYTQQTIFPDNAYGVDSGGDPRVIPSLTYEQFKSFHENYYHPSNARIFFYGDDNPEQRLQVMDGYLKDFDRSEVDSTISLQPKFDKPRHLTYKFASGEGVEAQKGMVVMNWLLTTTTNTEQTLALSILSHILIGIPASPLRKALIDSGFGEDLAGVGLEGELRQMYFSTGLKGVAVNSEDDQEIVEKIETLIIETLTTLVGDGIDEGTIAASVNTIEFSLRENNTGSLPQGLLLMLRSLTTWLYDGDPITPLAFEQPLSTIKKRLDRGEKFFEKLIETHFLKNTHRTTVVMEPDSEFDQREERREKERLEEIRSKMSLQVLKDTLENAQRLKNIQEIPDSPEALATIPSLQLDDLDKKNKLIPISTTNEKQTEILYHDLFTNGILYLDIGFDLRNLSQELLGYIPLFGRALLEMGTESEDFVQLSQRIGRITGGIRPSNFSSLIQGTENFAAWLFLRGKATATHMKDLLEIFQDILKSVRLDNRDRFLQILLEEKANREAMLAPGGHQVVNTRLRAQFNNADWFNENISGISSLLFLRSLINQVENDWPKVLQNLEMVRNTLINRRNMLCNVTLDQDNWREFYPHLVEFLDSLADFPVQPVQWVPGLTPQHEALIFPAQINFVGMGGDLYKLGYGYDGSVSVITKFLQTTWLWEKVRIQGGAYGGFCLFDYLSGVFTYLSYRDPRSLDTLDVYDQTGQFLQQLDLSEVELTKSIIGAIGGMDAYQLPDSKEDGLCLKEYFK
jgi:Zn-dependent M16 (insulinase) family peptidase